MTTNPTHTDDGEREAMRGQLEKAGLYDVLTYLHEQKHLKANCFCTTAISGAYGKLLDIIYARDKSQRQAFVSARIEELENLPLTSVDAAIGGKDWGNILAVTGKDLSERLTALHQLTDDPEEKG